MPKLLRYVAGTCAVLALAEGAFRVFAPELSASVSRAGTKAALLDKQGRVEVLFFGTSRLWDGISPRTFSAAFPGVHAFSLAASGAKLGTLETLARRFARRPGLRLAFVELSGPQLDPSPSQEAAPTGLEAMAARHSRLVANRGALRGESLERLPGLLFYPRRLDGSEIHFAEQVAAILGRPPPMGEFPALPPPSGKSRAAAGNDGLATDPSVARLLAVGRDLKAASIAVVFVVPPLQCEPPEDVSAAVAALSAEFPVWNYQRAPLPAAAFRDCGHLNARGRAAFSHALAVEAAGEGFAQALARRRD
ncbi:MAG TPA: hypothetical protein VFP52_13675 [Myxococcales bacterium]|nr:hypothetical protein [Myxococcales bacterium]